MRRLRLRVTHSRDTIHPVHRFEIRHEAFRGSALLHWNLSPDDTITMIFRVRGAPDPYRALLDGRQETVSYTVAPVGDGAFYCCVCERLSGRDRSYVHPVVDRTVVMVPPVRYNQDRTVDLTVVGSAAALDGVLEAFPDEVTTEVRSITDYRRHVAGTDGALTERQREAVEAAVSVGYYDSPRDGRVSDVAAELGVSTSTAAEHLRKAEARTMRRALDRG